MFLLSPLYFYHVTWKMFNVLNIYAHMQITNPKYIIHYPDTHHNHGLISTSIGLSMRITPQFFEHNTMRIKCVASISPVIWSGNKETIIQQGLQQFEIPLPSIDTREAMFLGEFCSLFLQLECERKISFEFDLLYRHRYKLENWNLCLLTADNFF
jgi:hypothetical protein